MIRLVFSGVLSLGLTASLALGQSKEPAKLTPEILRGLPLRNITSTLSSGRIADIAVDPRNRSVWYVAAASGGLWKTTNRGITFTPVFDDQVSYSVGCVVVDPNKSDVVWVGTGENQSQRSVGFGDGVYKSTDGGKTWKNVGLKTSEHIGKIVIDPRDSDTVYVAAQGPLWAPGGDRGLYKTTDGGKTWDAVLEIGEHTGVTDVVLDPKNPDVVYAAAYQRRRNNGVLIGGGPEGGIHKSEDGGKTWVKLKKGLPTGDVGRIALGISPEKPEVVYAHVTAAGKEGGFFRSDDGGTSWTRKSTIGTSDPQYYGEIVVDPKVFDKLYLMDLNVQISEDGGKTWAPARWPEVHVDNHALEIDPTDPNHLIVGNDGGLYESYDGGKTFRHFNTLPLSQFYRVGLDNSKPHYRIYGGAQDNGTQAVSVRTHNRVGIRSSDWEMVGGADGFQARVDPTDPDTVYLLIQNGGLSRLDRKTGAVTPLRPRAGGGKGEDRVRFHWDSPLVISPHNPKRLYFAGSRLFRSDDRGDKWTAISPDLTRQLDRSKIEIMGKLWGPDAVTPHRNTTELSTITALSESPVTEGLIYVGTDDGLVQVTEDGGKTWRKSDTFPDLPDRAYVSDIFASPHDANVAYLTFNQWQAGDFTPYLLKSIDKGKTWKSIRGDFPDRQPVWCVVEDPVKKGLLFAGTEFGLFVSVDDGVHWVQLKGGMASGPQGGSPAVVPPVPFRDLEIHPTEGDLVCATFGRGFFVLDDLTPLRQLTPEMLAGEGTVFRPRKTPLVAEQSFVRTNAHNVSSPNPPPGVVFTYFLPADVKDGKLVLTVTDADGKKVRELSGPTTAGFHRVNWDPVGRPFGGGGGGGFGGGGQGGGARTPPASPGAYMVTLGKQGKDKTIALGEGKLFELLAPSEP
jgi:photosystem II stability/assembly factor-like uncharacterized protein